MGQSRYSSACSTVGFFSEHFDSMEWCFCLGPRLLSNKWIKKGLRTVAKTSDVLHGITSNCDFPTVSFSGQFFWSDDDLIFIWLPTEEYGKVLGPAISSCSFKKKSPNTKSRTKSQIIMPRKSWNLRFSFTSSSPTTCMAFCRSIVSRALVVTVSKFWLYSQHYSSAFFSTFQHISWHFDFFS